MARIPRDDATMTQTTAERRFKPIYLGVEKSEDESCPERTLPEHAPKPHRRVDRNDRAERLGTDQAENDLPQPQLLWALGLLILKPPPVRASLKSITEPRM